MNKDLIAELETRRMIHEQPFHSDKPIIGPLIARFRAAWNSISTRWYVLPMLQQQNEFNVLLVSCLRQMEAAVEERLSEMDERLIDLDRDQTSLTRNVAELTYQLVRMNRLLVAVEAQSQGRDTDVHEA